MMRRLWFTACCCCLATAALGQEEPKGKEPPAVVELLEDDIDFFKTNLTNPGADDASIVDRSDETFYSGTASLYVTEFQRFNPNLPQWKFKIVENPGPGEYRYLRFAWKRTEGAGIMLQLHGQPPAWHRYYAGTLSKRTQSWGTMTRVADEVPRQWDEVTCDLYKDFGSFTLIGLGLSALEGEGQAYFDHIYLGRTIADLDRVTDSKRKIAEPPAPAGADDSRSWLIQALAIAGAVAVLLIGVVAWVRRSKSKQAAAGDGSAGAGSAEELIGFSCTACGKHLKVKKELAGKRIKCPGCGAAQVAP